ncbi:hypothetical protein ABCS02_28110 [Microbacterium sp. X-17]|uniref:hypothetical protein n=1 Tax=Microbacterium sp. X-17 TaxID=3144404 RepID=UPI0031F506A0
MTDTSAAIIIGASITSSVALCGVVATVIAGGRQQRRTLEFSAQQATLARQAEFEREARAAAVQRYERIRAILDPHVALAREMRSSTSGWQVIVGSQTTQQRIAQIIERVDAAWQVAEQRRGDFEIEPGLDQMRETFAQLSGAFNVFANIASSQTEGWVSFAVEKTQEIHMRADQFIEEARALVAKLEQRQSAAP